MRIIVESKPSGNKTWAVLPGKILRRLANNDIRSAEDWRRLSRTRKSSIFGIVPAMVRAIARAAGQERRT